MLISRIVSLIMDPLIPSGHSLLNATMESLVSNPVITDLLSYNELSVLCDNRQLLTSLPETYKDQFSPILESSRHVVGTLRDFSLAVSTPSQTITDWSI